MNTLIRNHTRFPAIAVALASGMLLTNGYAQTNIFDDFEGGFGPNGWVTAASPSTALTIATGVNKVPTAGNQSAKMAISTDVEAVTLPTVVGAAPWKFTYWLDDNDTAATRAFATVRTYSGGTYNSGSLQQLLAVGKYTSVDTGTYKATKYQGRVLYPTGAIGWCNLDDPGSPNRSSAWHKFDVVCGQNVSLDYVLLFYVDGILSRSFTNADYHWAYLPNSLTIGSIAGGSTAGTAYFDGVQVVQGIPFISSPPQGTTNTQGNYSALTVYATGNSPMYYQWRRSGTNIAEATDATYTIPNPVTTDSTTYTVVVSNSLDVATASAYLQINPLILVTIPPTNQLINLGSSVTFNAEVTGSGTLGYVWKHNGTALPGGTGTGFSPLECAYSIGSVSASDAGTYSLTVTNDNGDPATTVSAVLVVNTPPTVPTPPDTNATIGQAFTMLVSASDDFSAQAGPFQAFETNNVGSRVTFANPYQSGTTEPYVDGSGRTYVTNVFPAGHGSARVLFSHFTFTNVSGNWLRFTTTDGSSSGVLAANPVVYFNNPFRFDICSDKQLQIGLGLRESNSAGDIGSNGGSSSAGIEWAGVLASGNPPQATNIVPAGVWTTVVFPLPAVAVTSFVNGNGVLDSTTGKGILEDLCIADGTQPGQAGDYHIWLDNLVSMPTNALSFSLDAAPAGATIDSATGVITWTPPAIANELFTVRVTDNMGLSTAASFHVNATSAVRPALNIVQNGNHVVLTWTDATYSLQAAPSATGTYTNVTGAASGYSPLIGPGSLFFRLAR